MAAARRQSQFIPRQSSDNLAHNSGPHSQHVGPSQDSLPSLHEIHQDFVPTIRNVPLCLRRLWAQCLAKAFAQASWTNDVTSWTELQMLAKCTLCRPPRGGKSHLSQRLSWTRNRLNHWLAGERSQLWHDLPKYQRPRNKSYSEEAGVKARQDRCVSLASEGGFAQACNSLVGSPPLLHNADTTARLKEKHPPTSQPVDLSALGNPSNTLVPLAEVALVERSIKSFHRLSGGGPSGLKPIHIKNCLGTEHRDEILERCTAIVNLLSKGEAPSCLAPYLAGATLTALPKKDNSIRPVAVGEVLRRLTAKCLCMAYKEQASAFFFPLQIGVGHALGTEVGLATVRQWFERHNDSPSSIVAKIDFSNAFNCVDRQTFLEQCRHHFPGLSRWAEWCYSSPSNLFFGPETISSERGVQQGDPLGPLFFSLALQPILHRVNEGRSDHGLQLSFSFLDDLVLAGEQLAVSHAFHFVMDLARQIGLTFNTNKCEIIPTAGPNAQIDINLFPDGIKYREDGNFELLGGPIGSDSFCNEHTKSRVDKALEVLKALGELPDPQVALILLRHCASFSKLVYSLRVVPHQKHSSALQEFDIAVQDCVESFLGFPFLESDWTLATLSTKMGGLGLRKTELHSPAAFLASQIACHDLCPKLDKNFIWDPSTNQSDCSRALSVFNSRVKIEKQKQSLNEPQLRQQDLSQAIDNATLSNLKEIKAHDTHYLAHLNLITAGGAGAWLHATPSSPLSTHVDPLIYRTMIQRRLRVPIYNPNTHCPFCDKVMDVFGDHCLTCSCGGDRTKHHNLLRNEVYFYCNSIGLNPELERPGLLQPRLLGGVTQEDGSSQDNNGNRRPADIYIPRWRRGIPAALDFAVTSGLRVDLVNKSVHDNSAATEAYERLKRTYRNTEESCQAEGISFIPVICEADGGGWGPAAHRVWSELAKTKAMLTGEQNSTIANRLLQTLGLILHRENARAILRRFQKDMDNDLRDLLAASVVCNTSFDPY